MELYPKLLSGEIKEFIFGTGEEDHQGLVVIPKKLEGKIDEDIIKTLVAELKSIFELNEALKEKFPYESFSPEKVDAFHKRLKEEIKIAIRHRLVVDLSNIIITNTSNIGIKDFFEKQLEGLLELGAKSQEITNNIKSPNTFYFGFYGVSLPVILKVLKDEVGGKNHALLLNVIDQIPQITQEGKVFTGFNKTETKSEAEYSDGSKKEINPDIIRSQLLHLLKQVLENPKKISIALLEFNKNVSSSLIVEVLKVEVGRKNESLLQQVIKKLDITENKEKLIDLLTEILKNPQKIKTYLTQKLKEDEKPKQEDSNTTNSSKDSNKEAGKGLTELTPEQVILEYLKNPEEYKQLVTAVNEGMQALIDFNRKKYTSAPFALSTIMKEVKEFEEYIRINSREPSPKNYEIFKNHQKQKVEEKQESLRQEEESKASIAKQSAELLKDRSKANLAIKDALVSYTQNLTQEQKLLFIQELNKVTKRLTDKLETLTDIEKLNKIGENGLKRIIEVLEHFYFK